MTSEQRNTPPVCGRNWKTRGQQMSEQLKPCPFCGGPGKLKSEVGYTKWIVCDGDNCPISPECNHYLTETEAIAAWNTRSQQDDATVRKESK